MSFFDLWFAICNFSGFKRSLKDKMVSKKDDNLYLMMQGCYGDGLSTIYPKKIFCVLTVA